jgi:8-oxo-dGTP pyrophosphatase MutT (NUDIX family)
MLRCCHFDSWPSYYDNTVAGGLTYGDSPRQAMIRECEEEASLPSEFVSQHLRPAGIVSYVYRTQNGWIQPEQQFIYDLDFTKSAQPGTIISPITNPADGEVGSFELSSISEILDSMFRGEWKPNCALILVDWFIRMGLLNQETDSRFSETCRLLRTDLGVTGMS